jgi:type I restriction enzyme, S subunit
MTISQVLLKDICTINLGDNKKPEPSDYRSYYPIIGGGISPSGYTSTYNVNAGTIIINIAGYNIGRILRLDTPAYVNENAIYISNINDNIIDADYLYWYLTFEVTALSVPNIGNIVIMIPSTLEEQKWCASQTHNYVNINRLLPERRWKHDNFNPIKFLIGF